MDCKKTPINCKDMGREGQKRPKTEGKKRKINYRFHFHYYLRTYMLLFSFMCRILKYL